MILKGVATNIRALITDADGEPVAKDTEVTVKVVKDSDGSTVVAAGEAKTDEDGVATYELAAQSTLDRFTVTWTAGTSTFTTVEDMVGLRLCSLAQVEEDVTGGLTGAQKRLGRDIAEQFLEDECGVAFRPRYAKRKLDGTGKRVLYLPDSQVTSLRSATIGETALTEAELEDVEVYADGGYLWREANWTAGNRNVEVVYEHGFADPPPQARRAAALLARHIATKRLSNLEDRSSTYSTDEATYTLITPGLRGHMTALPEVNAFIMSWQFPEVG